MAFKVWLVLVVTLCGTVCATNMQDDLEAIRTQLLTKFRNEVCYNDIGCFSLDGPMNQTAQLPDSPKKINTTFYAYHALSPHTEEVLEPNGSFAHIDVSKRLAMVIHGWRISHTEEDMVKIKDALLTHSDGEVGTVIMVDWQNGAKNPLYNKAAANTQVVGRQIAYLIEQMKAKIKVDPKKVYLVGFSLGAHVAHFAGNHSQSQYGWKFGRITGLDAAGPLFEGHPGAFLTRTDADLVDAIHTSVGSDLLQGEIGFSASYGHVDFYPNGGNKQPMCSNIQHVVSNYQESCNHHASCKFYEASLSAHNSCCFKAYNCTSYEDYEHGKCTVWDTELGYFAEKYPATGDQYLDTSDEFPFCNQN